MPEDSDAYREAGVDLAAVDTGLSRIVRAIRATWPAAGIGRVALDIGYFANVLDIGGGTGLAICTDGVGSKSIIADMMRRWDTIGIDCVAMNVNDLICVGATPLSMVDYIAVEAADADMLAALHELLPPAIKRIEVDAGAEDEAFVAAAVAQLTDLIAKRRAAA